jgi:hypothetical protein
MVKRLDTRLESEAAEFLVLGQLLLERTAPYKTYTNMPGYDLVATDPEKNTSAKIQVKSRWRTNAPGFPIRNFGCDFVVFCRLNRGTKAGSGKIRAPEYFVFPVAAVQSVWNADDKWGKVTISQIPNWEAYLNKWEIIRDYLDPGAGALKVSRPQRNRKPRPTAFLKVSPAEFRRRASALDGQTLVTPKLLRPFLIRVDEGVWRSCRIHPDLGVVLAGAA